MNLSDGDTIAAIATAAGKAGIGIIRVSGPAALEIASQITHATPQPRQAQYRRFLDAQNQVIDDGIVIFYKAPASFTGEDVLELQAHSNPVVLDLMLERVLQLGARLAQPGEFSQRAFLNNKYDLLQLEAIADLVNSSSRQAARSIQRALQGEVSAVFMQIAERIKILRVQVEAELDFSDEDIDTYNYAEIEQNLNDIIQEIKKLRKKAQQSLCLYEGAEVVIAGQANVGKSSLLNQLAMREEAIVNEQPGTTRDIISCELVIDGIPIRLLDTAGIRETQDVVEQEGMRRTHQATEASDLLLLLVDARHGITHVEHAVIEQFNTKSMLIVFNKIDLLPAPVDNENADVQISAKTGAGIESLKQRIKAYITQGGFLDSEGSAVFANRRHLDAMDIATKALSEIALRHGSTTQWQKLELVAEHLRIAQQALASITGAYSTEELLEDIFSRFCLGK